MRYHLVTVTATFGLPPGEDHGSFAERLLARLMAHPEVITVRVAAGSAATVFRLDVDAEDDDAAAGVGVSVARQVADEERVAVDVGSVEIAHAPEIAAFEQSLLERLGVRRPG